jgi:hypothetical protein
VFSQIYAVSVVLLVEFALTHVFSQIYAVSVVLLVEFALLRVQIYAVSVPFFDD